MSFFNHQARVPEWPYYKEIRAGLSLKDFVLGQRDFQTNNHLTRVLAGLYSNAEAPLRSRKYLDMALEQIRRDFLFVGAMDYLPQAIGILAERLGWTGWQLPRLNADPDPSCSQLDAVTRAAIEECNLLDRELYDFVRQTPFLKEEAFTDWDRLPAREQ